MLSELVKLLKAKPLYEAIHLSGKDANDVLWVIQESALSFDAYCPDCRANTTWRAQMQAGQPRLGGLQPGVPLRHDYFAFLVEWLRDLTFRCARTPGHEALFSLKVESTGINRTNATVVGVKLTKFGQLPSLADIAASEVDIYRAYVDPADLRELTRAVGLAAHGIGIGSFVYLRRIFERLVNGAADKAAADDSMFDGKAFVTLRMDEKLQAVKGYVPDWMVDNRKLYSILSLGLHELSEDACKAAFPAVKEAILSLLEQHAEQVRRAERAKAAAKALTDLSQTLSEK